MELNHPHSLAGHLPILRAYQGISQALGQPRLPGARCPLQDQISLVAETLERVREIRLRLKAAVVQDVADGIGFEAGLFRIGFSRSEEHTSELQSLMRISYAVFCLKKKNR